MAGPLWSPGSCCLHSLLLLVPRSLVAVQTDVFAVDFIMFASLLWAHSTKPLAWGHLTGGVTAQERHPRVCQAAESPS